MNSDDRLIRRLGQIAELLIDPRSNLLRESSTSYRLRLIRESILEVRSELVLRKAGEEE